MNSTNDSFYLIASHYKAYFVFERPVDFTYNGVILSEYINPQNSHSSNHIQIKNPVKMTKNLVVMAVGIFIMSCNSANSETEDCIALCNECVKVSDTLTHMGCTKHCKKLKQKDDDNISCSKLTAPHNGNPSLEDEINAIHAKMSELVESRDFSTIVEEFYADDCVAVLNGQAPVFDMTQCWFDWFESNPSVTRVSYTSTAFGENSGKVWEDVIGHAYKDDALIGSFGYMYVYKRINGTLVIFIEIILF
ncbi:uncharacterized protein [Amphiura filiformis]|uniref:uncharacterized protein isoform X2 n=1 Tax=Amphiura filiformis TaxID=82378 RepID=UPI003B21ABF1